MIITTHSHQETTSLGQKMARCVKAGDIICLFGDLGTGKTTMVKGMAQGLKIKDSKVHSPTFVLLNIYSGKLSLFHFDFYRLEETQEILRLGIDDFLYGNGVSVIEWADRLGHLMPREYLEVRLQHRGEEERQIEFLAHGKRYQQVVQALGKAVR